MDKKVEIQSRNSIAGSPGTSSTLIDLKKKIEEMLCERARLVEEEGPESIDVVGLNCRIGEMVEFCEKHGIEGVSRLEILRRMDQSNEPVRQRVEALRAKYRDHFWQAIEERVEQEARLEAEKLLPLELEKARQKRRREAIEARRELEGLKAFHLVEEEDPGSCEIVYRGPVFRLLNTGLHAGVNEGGENPFLLSTYVFGVHPACFHELQEGPADFMAALHHDSSEDRFVVKAIDPSIMIKRQESDAFSPFMQSQYHLQEGELVKLGKYHLQVERGHGYSQRALAAEAQSHLVEMLEIIFDTARTNESHDREAYLNIGKVLGCNLPDDCKANLRAFLSSEYSANFEKQKQMVRSWSVNNPKPDACEFSPLLMTLKAYSAGEKYFDFQPGLTLEDLSAEALRRVVCYSEVFAGGRCVGECGWMLVEITRFLEMGLLQPAEIRQLALPAPWPLIEKILEVRKAVDLLNVDSQEQLGTVIKLVGMARGLCLSEVYGADEIMIRNQNVDLKLTPDLPVVATSAGQESYVAQLCRKIARNAWHKLGQKRTAEERSDELSLIKALIDLGKVRPIHLVDIDGQTDPLAREREIEKKMLELESGIVSSLRREDLERREMERARLLAEKALGDEYAERRSALDRAMQGLEKFWESRSLPDIAQRFWEVGRCAAFFRDEGLRAVVAGCLHWVAVEPLERQLSDGQDRVFTVQLQAAPPERDWSQVVREWEVELEDLAAVAEKEIVRGGRSVLWLFLLQQAAKSHAGLSEQLAKKKNELERVVEREQFRLLRRSVLLPNEPGAEHIWPGWLEGEPLRQYEKFVDRIRLKIAQRFMSDLLIKIVEGDQAEKHRELARKLLMEVPGLRYTLSIPEHDLLL